jgi:CubicO group peptidase (beta-lactamase class C family)
MIKKFAIISLIVLSLSHESLSSENTDSHAKQIENLLTELVETNLFNGAILVAEEGEIVYQNAFGAADFDSGRLLTIDSPFYLASVSKQFTAMSIMMLAEEGKLSYEDSLSKYFPEFPEYADDITIEHLLRHASGIRDYFGLVGLVEDMRNSDVLEVLIRQESTNFKPNEQFDYTNSGYVLLSMIAEKSSGQPFHELLENKIFGPLNMDSTLVYDESRPEILNRAIGFTGRETAFDYNILTTGDGGMYSTVVDLFKWDQALYSEKLVGSDSLQSAFSGTYLNNGETSNYGYGWQVRDNIVSHGGSLVGFRTHILRDMGNHQTIILLTNKLTGINLNGLSSDIQDILNNPN